MIDLIFEKMEESPHTSVITRTDDNSPVLTIDLTYNPNGVFAHVYEGKASNDKTQMTYHIEREDSSNPQGLINFIEYLTDYIISYQILVCGHASLRLTDITRINKFIFRIVRKIVGWEGGREAL